ncbi:MAG: tryptophan halogenase family protein [Polyangiaceae bacterium]
MNAPSLRRVVVVGGGTAGYFAALAIRAALPSLTVVLVESSAVPIIGVGEATTTLMPPFLHQDLGIDAVELFEAVRPTFKLGIRFLWGPATGEFSYPFGDADPIEAYVHDGDLRSQSLVAMLMATDRAPVLRGPAGELLSLLPRLKFAYHLDNAPFVRFLAERAAKLGIEHVELTVASVERSENGDISALIGTDGARVHGDFFIDASGFRSLLVEDTLGSPFQSWDSSLFCDRAIVATVPQAGVVQPYTTAETMNAGWCWRIPVEGEDHRGYVHASAFLDEDRAVEEMRAKNPGMSDPWIVRFRSGRHRDFWLNNTVAVGNAYGFVEPLESTALHMVIIELAYLVRGLGALLQGDPTYRDFANRAVGDHWDFLRWFLAVHYRYNDRLDTPFWSAARREVDISGLEADVELLRTRGARSLTAKKAGDPAFGVSGLLMLLLGQRVAPREVFEPVLDEVAWRDRTTKQRGIAARALPQSEALAVLRANPDMLRAFQRSPASWCTAPAERAARLAATGQLVGPTSGLPAVASDESLTRALRK